MKAPCGLRQKKIVTFTKQSYKSIKIDIDYAIPNCATNTNKTTQQTVRTHTRATQQTQHTHNIHVQRPHARESAGERLPEYSRVCVCMRACVHVRASFAYRHNKDIDAQCNLI